MALSVSGWKTGQTLPGSNESFTVKKFKEDCGVTYSRITLYLCPVSEEVAQRTEDKSQALCTDEAVHTSLNCDDEIDFICEDNVDGILELDHLDETFTLIKELFPGKADDVIIPVIEVHMETLLSPPTFYSMTVLRTLSLTLHA